MEEGEAMSEEKPKICPLLYIAVVSNSGYHPDVMTDLLECKQEKCAWWEEKQKRCAILDIPKALTDIWATS